MSLTLAMIGGVRMLWRSLFVLGLIVVLSAPIAAAQPKAEEPKKGVAKKMQTAVITLAKGGQITIEFFPKDAPKAVENFVKLARGKFYDGTFFHRVESGFVIQGGDPLTKTLKPGDPKLGTGGPGYTIKAEFNKRRHERGVVAMARRPDPDSAGSQFYITLAPAYRLDGQYTIFGRVTSGMDVVDGVTIGDRIASIKIVEE